MDDPLNQAITLHRQGRLAEAEDAYKSILSRQPNLAEALQFLGEVQGRQGKTAQARETLRKALALTPNSAQAHYNLAVAETSLGNSQEAIDLLQKATTLQPVFPEALNNLGLLLHKQGRYDEAAAVLKKALAQKPNHFKALNNLGQTRFAQGRNEEALDAFMRSLQLSPDFPAATTGAAYALRKLARRKEAAAAFHRAAELSPDSAQIHWDAAMALLDIGRGQLAIERARRAVDLTRESGDRFQRGEALRVLGVALYPTIKNDPEARKEVIRVYEEAISLCPERTEWVFEHAAVTEQAVKKAPDSFVKGLFNEYAPGFEKHLVDELKYHVPWDLREAVLKVLETSPLPSLKPAHHQWNVLDLGCGTGLCGEVFREDAKRIVGVDLAPNMLAIARKRVTPDARKIPIYDELLEMHIVDALKREQAAFHLILAGDVFIYVGGLEDILPAAAQALLPGGMIAFSLEFHEGDGVILHGERRFAHSISYIQNLAAASGLTEAYAQRKQLRTDVAPGWIVVLQK